MRTIMGLFVMVTMLISGARAQSPDQPVLRQGISVQMAVAGHPVEMRAADELDATVIAITAAGKVFSGVTATEPGALSSLTAGTVYVKSDARASFQTVLAVLDALRGKTVVLLTAPPASLSKQRIVAPYGIRLNVPR